ncbi:MAG: hypothetical protein ACRCZI_12280, partial [Cetobacterium sp.]
RFSPSAWVWHSADHAGAAVLMAGRGPAPKRGEKLGRPSVAKSSLRTEVQVGAAPNPRRPVPDGSWHRLAVAWWDAVAASGAAELWEPEDWLAAHRGLALVDRFWNLIDDGATDTALKVHAELRRAEVSLYLSPAERARAGITVEGSRRSHPSAQVSDLRGRLRALDGA